MRVRWTTKAADDLAHIVEYIRKDNPAVALRVARTIYQGIAGLRRTSDVSVWPRTPAS
jgi:plasmid stabilization system protein ParE